MNANFARSLAAVLRHEGGYSNHPNDPGGPTNRGITLATFRKWIKKDGTANDLKRITDDQVAKIYRSVYWNGVKGDDLPGGIDYAVFDYAVNSGQSRAVKSLQMALGVNVDGILGPVTLAAAKSADPIKVIAAVCDQRMKFLRNLSTWPTFGKGWTSRVEDVRLDAIQLTAKPSGPVILPTTPNPPPPDIPPPAPKPTPEKRGGINWWVVIAVLVALGLFAAAAFIQIPVGELQ